MASGHVYILTNESLKGLVKIGKSTRPPEERAAELSGTSLPTRYHVAYDEEVWDCDLAERLIHQRLKYCRKNPKREFFKIPLRDAIKVVAEVVEGINQQSPSQEDTERLKWRIIHHQVLPSRRD